MQLVFSCLSMVSRNLLRDARVHFFSQDFQSLEIIFVGDFIYRRVHAILQY